MSAGGHGGMFSVATFEHLQGILQDNPHDLRLENNYFSCSSVKK